LNAWAIIPLISSLTFAILVVVVLQQARKRADKIFALFLAASGIWSLTSFMLVFNTSSPHLVFWNGMVITAIPLVGICYYHFVRAYNNKPGGIVLYIGYAFVLTTLALSLSGHVVKSAYFVNGFLVHDIKPWDYIVGGGTFPFLATAMLMLVQRYRKSTDPSDRNRTAYLIIGSGIAIVGGYITSFTPTLAGLPTDHLGNFANALIISYAILRYQLLSVRFVIRRGVAYFLVFICLGSIYAITILLGRIFFPTQPTYNIVSIATIFVLVLALLARPLRHAIQKWVDRFFYRGTYESRQILLNFNARMGNILNLEQLANEMLPAMTKALHITQAKLLFQDSSDDFTTQFIYPEMKDKPSDELKLNNDNPIIAWLDKETRPLDLKQLDSIPEFKGLWESEKGQVTASNLGLLCPIKSRGRLVGILGLGNKQSDNLYTHDDLDLMMRMSNQAGIIIENAQLYSQALVRANTDGLTGLYNHRHFHERIDQEIARGSRFGTMFSLIMLDIDLFKTYNDIYGHLAGDEVLRRIGGDINSAIRSIDLAFRYGGEEFTIILPETRLEDAYKVAERMRKTIESQTSSRAMPITISLGVASWPTDGVMKEEIITRADAALYRAKQLGRNRTCLSSEVMRAETSVASTELETQPKALSMIYALAATVDAKDHYTYGHSKKVSQYAVVLSEALGLPQDRTATIRAAGLLHDIGKIAIPDSILNKAEALTKKEWKPVKAHPQLGVEILRHVIDLVNCLPAILHHHEHYDGQGYPSGLKGENIPLEARILAIADAYDAITSMRPYREQLSPQQALDELKRCVGTQFDPELVDIFCKIMGPTPSNRLEIK